MEKIIKYISKSIIIGFLFAILNSCISQSVKTTQFTLQINNIGFECTLPKESGDTLKLNPIIMYIDMAVINNTDGKILFGAYNHRYNQNNKKFGRFELISDRDTIALYSDYPYKYEIEPRQAIQMQLHYEGLKLFGYDEFLNKMSIAWIDKDPNAENLIGDRLKKLQNIIETLKIRYVSFDNESFVNDDFNSQISKEIGVDYVYSDDKVIEIYKQESGWIINSK